MASPSNPQLDKVTADAAEFKAGYDKLAVDAVEQKAVFDKIAVDSAEQKAQVGGSAWRLGASLPAPARHPQLTACIHAALPGQQTPASLNPLNQPTCSLTS